MTNQIKTTMLMALMTVCIMLVGNMIGGQSGMFIALIMAGGMNFFSYWYSDKLVLKMYKAREVNLREEPLVYGIVEKLARAAELPMPKVYIIPQDSPNAFATGRNPENAVVAVTQGLVRAMNPEELEGVIAHELGHIKNRDILIGTIAATMAGAIMMLANIAKWSAIFGGFRRNNGDGGSGAIGLIAMALVAPFAAMLIKMAISRSREYLADATAAKITKSPEGLASALEKLGSYSRQVPMRAEPATAHMFIANPLSGRNLTNWFSTHPPIEHRVAKLRGLKVESNLSQNEENPLSDKADSMTTQGKNFWDKLS